MTERPFVLLTQPHCPQCERLERLLSGPLRGQYAEQIEIVHRGERPDDFTRLAEAHGLRSTPALVHRASGEVLVGTPGLGEVQRFLVREPA